LLPPPLVQPAPPAASPFSALLLPPGSRSARFHFGAWRVLGAATADALRAQRLVDALKMAAKRKQVGVEWGGQSVCSAGVIMMPFGYIPSFVSPSG
jgi:hypothetical protein